MKYIHASFTSAFYCITILVILLNPSHASAFQYAMQGTTYNPGVTEYRSYIGGSDNDVIVSLESDQMDNTFVIGYSNSEEFPTIDPTNHLQGNYDVFLAKVSSTGALQFFQFFGGDYDDIPHDSYIHADGTITVVGSTLSPDLPITANAFQTDYNGSSSEGFIAQFSPAGDLLYCSYIGGQDDDEALGVVVDQTGGIFVMGVTSSEDFPILNPTQGQIRGTEDFFLSHLDPGGENMTFSTFWGSSLNDSIELNGNPMVIDSTGHILIAASTSSHVFPHTRTADNVTMDSFIVKFNTAGDIVGSIFPNTTALSDEDDFANAIGLGNNGYIYLAGYVYRNIWVQPEGGGDYQRAVDSAIYLSKIDDDLFYDPQVIRINGFRNETSTDMTINQTGHIILSGQTESLNFPKINEIEEFSGGIDAFLSIHSPEDLSPVFSSPVGGVDDETQTHVSVNSLNHIIIGGTTNSIDLIPVNAFQNFKSDTDYGNDGYLWSIDLAKNVVVIEPEPITIEIDWILLSALVLPPAASLVFLGGLSRRMKKKRLVAVDDDSDSDTTNPF